MGSFDDVTEFIRIERERTRSAERLKTTIRDEIARNHTPPEKHVTFDSQVVIAHVERNHVEEEILAYEDVAETPNSGVNVEDSTNVTVTTNIPFSGAFIAKIMGDVATFNIERSIAESEKQTHPRVQKEMMMEVNKRLSQVSTDKAHLDKVCETLRRYSGSYLFVKIFVHKILDQGRLQVTKHPKSYVAYSYLFCTLYSREMISYFRAHLFTLRFEPLYGVYLIYFGILKFKQSVREACAFIKSVLGATQNRFSSEVIEWFLTVLGPLLKSKAPSEFVQICSFIESSVVCTIENKACAERIRATISVLSRK